MIKCLVTVPSAVMLSLIWFNKLRHSYEQARRILGDHFFAAGDATPGNACVAMIHASMEKDSGELKKIIMENLTESLDETPLRLVISSVALGMEVDLRHVTRVIHAGPPTSLETYVQEIGRAGRSGVQSEAILYFNMGDVGVKGMTQDMKMYCTNTELRRRNLINEYFGFTDKED